MLLLLVRRRGSPCRHGSPRAHAGSGDVAACMQAHEMERLRVVPRMHGHAQPSKRDGCGARELGASGKGTGAPCDASALDQMSRS
jgi:hypothetical protein